MKALYGNEANIRIDCGSVSVVFPECSSEIGFSQNFIEKTNLSGRILRINKGFYPKVTFTLRNYKSGDESYFNILLSLINSELEMTVYPRYKEGETNLVFTDMKISEDIKLSESDFYNLQSLEITMEGQTLLPSIPIIYYALSGYGEGGYNDAQYGG